MINIKRLVIGIIAIVCFVSFIVLPTGKAYNYTIESTENITNEQVKVLKTKINKVYQYFEDKGYVLNAVKFILSNEIKINDIGDEIVIDSKNISDFELIQIILQHEFSEYLNYGLMYGVIHDIAKTYDLKFEVVNRYSIEKIEEYWEYMFLSYINFMPEIASESEVEIAKYVATELVNYILDKYGSDYLFDLMKKSSELVHTNKVSEVLEEWIKYKGSDFTDIRIINREIFNQNSTNDTLAFSTENIYWVLNLNNNELYSNHYLNMHEDTKTFYEYMNIFYEEISRLEKVLIFDLSKITPVTVEIYTDSGLMGGFYDKHYRKISIDTAYAFSHEFVHFVDECFNRKFKYAAYAEMRAVYYSRNFQLGYILEIYGYETMLEEIRKNELILIDPLAEVEKYLGRKLSQEDYSLLFNDVMIHILIEAGEEIPKLFDVSRAYPSDYWISLFNFINRTYGEKAIDTIMFDEKLPDGTEKDITSVIEEWQIYITHLTKSNYDNYYK